MHCMLCVPLPSISEPATLTHSHIPTANPIDWDLKQEKKECKNCTFRSTFFLLRQYSVSENCDGVLCVGCVCVLRLPNGYFYYCWMESRSEHTVDTHHRPSREQNIIRKQFGQAFASSERLELEQITLNRITAPQHAIRNSDAIGKSKLYEFSTINVMHTVYPSFRVFVLIQQTDMNEFRAAAKFCVFEYFARCSYVWIFAIVRNRVYLRWHQRHSKLCLTEPRP